MKLLNLTRNIWLKRIAWSFFPSNVRSDRLGRLANHLLQQHWWVLIWGFNDHNNDYNRVSKSKLASWLITMQDSLKYNIPQTSWSMKLKFCILLDIYRSNNFTQSFQMGLVRHPWACPELCEIMSHLKNELSYKVFCLWLGIDRSYKFLYSFQVRVVRDAHSVWK